MARRHLPPALALGVALFLSATPARAEGWRDRIDDTVGKKAIGVSVRLNGRVLYAHKDRYKRIPASNQKLLMTMTLLTKLDPGYKIRTFVRVPRGSVEDGVVNGDLWLIGRGDPTITDGGRYARSLYMEPTRIKTLAKRIKNKGITRITGRVMGSTGYFAHDWFAPGWKPDFPVEEVPMPTALTFDGNRVGDTHIADPERRAARALAQRLRDRGIKVGHKASQAPAPGGLLTITKVKSRILQKLLTRTNRQSSNFFAEVLGKRLAVETFGPPGTIANGARAIARFASRNGVAIESYDSSGLSYDNRVTPRGMTKLLAEVEDRKWIRALREMLPTGDQGTLVDRLQGVRVRAKTGSLSEISTLSGWVWLKNLDRWCAFSIMSRGMEKPRAANIEDRIVKILTNSAH